MSKETSKTGVVRRRPNRSAAEDALASAHQAFVELLDAAQAAMRREAQMADAESLAVRESAKRAPALEGRR